VNDDVFMFHNGAWYWNMQGGETGSRFCSWNTANDVNNEMHLWYFMQTEEDMYDLDGKTFGLMSWSGGVAGKALMNTSSEAGAMDAKALTVMSNAQNNDDKLYVPNDSDISMWTFKWAEQDYYYLMSTVNGATKYLNIDENGLSMSSESCLIRVVPGTGIHAGQIYLQASGRTLAYSGNIDNGFNINGIVGNEWLYFVELSELTTDYLLTYSAEKVSVSDPAVTNGSRVIVYTRIWDEEDMEYKFYAIDSDGSLVRVFESGNSIEWISGQINTLLWNFVEYYWEGTTDPNYYYELYNQYSDSYIAPQVTGDQTLSFDTIGVNMNGRRDGRYSSTILAWDSRYYSFVGLKAENGRVVACPKSEAMEFYFAIMQDLNVDDDLILLPTVDHTQYGITMKMIDFNSRKQMSDFLDNDSGGTTTNLVQGLLSTNLGEDGYPVAASGSLGNLYAGAEEVNHLFIQTSYNESGYFAYDSTQSFASLDRTTNNFKVYKELGTYDSAGGRPTLKHGQFFPYNDLTPGVFASVNGKNLYSLTGDLSDSDPRKYERLYSLEHDNVKVNCHFGVELEASFTQTPNGLDAMGNDIVFEFTGDDDFWLYVDGELVLDLGGIHSAVPGSVNFRTGAVNVNGRPTTLRQLFESNYRSRNPQATDEQVAEFLSQYFDEGKTVFKDYTSHTMRIFYMERGGGASNLQMHFNLAAAKQGTVQLNKKLANVDASESVLAEFLYQIRYKTEEDEGD
ncbi:MAG: fibro-slime domain-containing protein, partial [Erysipelotrichaceae bacterium]|nr:fibro-slime domain-containing protein [Erysipelotrichaceae bacterium]